MKTRSLSMYLRKWCHTNGFDVSIRYGQDFACNVIDNIIQYSFITDIDQDKMFHKVFADEGLGYECDTFILSFFHELGHFMTDDNWTDKQSNRFMIRKSKLDGAKVKDNFKYFYMPDEIMATRWAIDFINANPNLIADFWKGVQEKILNIYREMGYEC